MSDTDSAALVVAILGVVLAGGTFFYTWITDRRAEERDRKLMVKEHIQSYADVQPNMSLIGDIKKLLESQHNEEALPWYVRVYREADYKKPIEEARQKMSGFWDMTIECYEEGLLPKDKVFGSPEQGRGKWLRRANNFCDLCEPLDIANYYRNGFHKRGGSNDESYLEHRPTHYEKIGEQLAIARQNEQIQNEQIQEIINKCKLHFAEAPAYG